MAQLPDLDAAHPYPGALVRARGRDRPARRPCRHHPRVSRRRQVNRDSGPVAAADQRDDLREMEVGQVAAKSGLNLSGSPACCTLWE